MMNFSSPGKVLILIGIVCIVIGAVLLLFNKTQFPVRLPGDILIQKKNFTFYFPVVASIVLSIILTLIFYFINRFRQ